MTDPTPPPADAAPSPSAPDSPPSPSPPPSVDVAQVLEQLRAGVRQRRAEAVTLGEGSEATRSGLLALRAREYVREPVVVSHRARFGGLIVFVRKAAFHLFLKPFFRPLLEQQNAYNETASRLIQDLAEGAERQTREVRELRARVAALEAALEKALEGAAPASDVSGAAAPESER